MRSIHFHLAFFGLYGETKMDSIDQLYDETRDRIFEAMRVQNMSQKTLAEELGISPQTITDWKTGKSRSFGQGRMLGKIAFVLAVNGAWLLSGDGPMLKGIEVPDPRRDEKTEQFLDLFLSLDDKAQNEIVAEMLKRKK